MLPSNRIRRLLKLFFSYNGNGELYFCLIRELIQMVPFLVLEDFWAEYANLTEKAKKKGYIRIMYKYAYKKSKFYLGEDYILL